MPSGDIREYVPPCDEKWHCGEEQNQNEPDLEHRGCPNDSA